MHSHAAQSVTGYLGSNIPLGCPGPTQDTQNSTGCVYQFSFDIYTQMQHPQRTTTSRSFVGPTDLSIDDLPVRARLILVVGVLPTG